MDKTTLIEKKEAFIIDEKADEKSARTLIHYEHVIKMFIEFLKSEEVLKKDVVEFKSYLLDRYNPSTVANYLTIVNKFLKYVKTDSTMDEFKKVGLTEDEVYEFKKKIRTNSIDKDSAELVRKVLGFNEAETLTVKNIKIQQRSSIEEIINRKDYHRLMNTAKRMGNLKMHMIIKVLRETGIRIEELKFFTVESIKSYYIRVDNKGKIRNVIVKSDLRRELKLYCKEQGIISDYIFPGREPGTSIHPSTVWKNMKKIAGKAKVKKSKVYAHSLRHLFAVEFLEQGGNITELSDLLGHASVETTRIYVRTTDEMKRKKMDKMRS